MIKLISVEGQASRSDECYLYLPWKKYMLISLRSQNIEKREEKIVIEILHQLQNVRNK
jgi:hypothetical protein